MKGLGDAIARSERTGTDMKNTLYIHSNRASSHGRDDCPMIKYSGDKPNRVICLHTSDEILYFTDEREAHAVMQAQPFRKVRMLPVID